MSEIGQGCGHFFNLAAKKWCAGWSAVGQLVGQLLVSNRWRRRRKRSSSARIWHHWPSPPSKNLNLQTDVLTSCVLVRFLCKSTEMSVHEVLIQVTDVRHHGYNQLLSLPLHVRHFYSEIRIIGALWFLGNVLWHQISFALGRIITSSHITSFNIDSRHLVRLVSCL